MVKEVPPKGLTYPSNSYSSANFIVYIALISGGPAQYFVVSSHNFLGPLPIEGLPSSSSWNKSFYCHLHSLALFTILQID